MVGFDAADHVVCAWSDRDHVFGYVDVEVFAEFVDTGEAFCEVFLVEVSDVEVDVGRAGF